MINKIASLIKNANKIAVLGHIKTDFDCVCSCLAFRQAMLAMDKQADIFIDTQYFKPQMSTLPDFDVINTASGKDKYDLYVCLDTATIDRLGKNKYKIMKNRAISCQIDHHGSNDGYCKYNYIKSPSSSNCEILYSLFGLLNIKITPVMAKLLITGIHADCGNLTYNNTTSDTYFVVGKLLERYNDEIGTILEPIFMNDSLPEFELKKFAYGNTNLYYNDKISALVITEQDFISTKSTLADTSYLVTIGKNISTVKIAIMISQDVTQDNCYFVSIRSKGNYNSGNVASVFGGGGHINAAGCKIFDTIDNVTARLIKAAEAEIDRVEKL